MISVVKKFLSVFCAAALMFTISACKKEAPQDTQTENTSVTNVISEASTAAGEGFSVQGTKLLDANGNEFIFRGINHAHAWFRDQDETAIDPVDARQQAYT